MADIRIKDLATTAASTASDDFVAVDGSANGTRKLSAYNPSFGGTGTFGGTVTINSNVSYIGKSGSGTGGNWRFVSDDGTTRWLAGLLGTVGETTFSIYDIVNSRQTLALTAAGNATLAGNLTVSGTGTSDFSGNVRLANTKAIYGYTFAGATGALISSSASDNLNVGQNNANWAALNLYGGTGNVDIYSGATGFVARFNTAGNFLVGTTVDSGAKLQVGTDTTTSAGGMIFGTDVRLFRSGTGVIRISSTANYSTEITNSGGTGAASILFSNTGGSFIVGSDSSAGTALGGGTAYAGVITTTTNVPLILRTNSTTALTLDSSQNATFAGKITSGTWADVVSARLGIATSANSYAATIANNASSGGAYALRLHTTGTASSDYIVVGSSGASAGSIRFLADGAGNFVVNNAAIATNATDGFLYVSTCAGTPTGTPTSYTGRAPIVVDTTNNKLYFYSGGQWRDAGP